LDASAALDFLMVRGLISLALMTLAAMLHLAAAGTHRHIDRRSELLCQASNKLRLTPCHGVRGIGKLPRGIRSRLIDEDTPERPDALAIVESDETSSSTSRSDEAQKAAAGSDDPGALPAGLHPIAVVCTSTSHPLIYRLHTLLI
jgi:hypothetical protein